MGKETGEQSRIVDGDLTIVTYNDGTTEVFDAQGKSFGTGDDQKPGTAKGEALDYIYEQVRAVYGDEVAGIARTMASSRFTTGQSDAEMAKNAADVRSALTYYTDQALKKDEAKRKGDFDKFIQGIVNDVKNGARLKVDQTEDTIIWQNIMEDADEYWTEFQDFYAGLDWGGDDDPNTLRGTALSNFFLYKARTMAGTADPTASVSTLAEATSVITESYRAQAQVYAFEQKLAKDFTPARNP